MKNEKVEALARLAASIIMPALTAFGISVDADGLIVACGAIVSAVAVLWAWWKNNNMTECACEAQKVLDELKIERELK